MKRSARLFIIGIVSMAGFFLPAIAQADTLSVTQVIVITARVAPARSIILNDKGQMTKIYSNTDEPVTPRVYVNKTTGPQRPLTPELQSQYQAVISQHKKLNGVAIDVPLPAQPLLPAGLRSVLTQTVSIILR